MNEKNGSLTIEIGDGKTIHLRVVELLERNNQKYVLMQDTEKQEEESYIFRFIEDREYDQLESIEDGEELELLVQLFEEKMFEAGKGVKSVNQGERG